MDAGFLLRILPQGITLRAGANQNLLDAANRAGAGLTHSCRNGYCGACRARLLAGAIEYPSGQQVTAAIGSGEAPEIMLCIARARSDVEIEPVFPARGT